MKKSEIAKLAPWPQKFWNPTRGGMPYPIMPSFRTEDPEWRSANRLFCAFSYPMANQRRIALSRVGLHYISGFCGGGYASYFLVDAIPMPFEDEGGNQGPQLPRIEDWMGPDWKRWADVIDVKTQERRGRISDGFYDEDSLRICAAVEKIVTASLFWSALMSSGSSNQNLLHYWDYRGGPTEHNFRRFAFKGHGIMWDSPLVTNIALENIRYLRADPYTRMYTNKVVLDSFHHAKYTINRNSSNAVASHRIASTSTNVSQASYNSKAEPKLIHLSTNLNQLQAAFGGLNPNSRIMDHVFGYF